MKSYIEAIAQISKNARKQAILSLLQSKKIPYHIQAAGRSENIVVSLGGEGRKTVIGAHYDNACGTPGANDNACACAILVKLSEALLHTQRPTDIVFFDNEELGGVGSRDYLWDLGEDNAELMVNLDMCGMGEHTVVYFYDADRPHSELFTKLQSDSGIFKATGLPFGDAYTFMEAGIPTVYVVNSTTRDLQLYGSYEIGDYLFPSDGWDFFRTMHRPDDTVETINPTQVEKIYEYIANALR